MSDARGKWTNTAHVHASRIQAACQHAPRVRVSVTLFTAHKHTSYIHAHAACIYVYIPAVTSHKHTSFVHVHPSYTLYEQKHNMYEDTPLVHVLVQPSGIHVYYNSAKSTTAAHNSRATHDSQTPDK